MTAINNNTLHAFETLPYTECEILYQNKHGRKMPIINKLTQTLQYHTHKEEARTYWLTKKKLEDKENEILWKVRSRSLKSSLLDNP